MTAAVPTPPSTASTAAANASPAAASYEVPLSAGAGQGLLLDSSARQRSGLSWYRPTRVQLLAAPKQDGAPEAPAWSALVMDGVTVPYEEVARLKMDTSALEFIVEQLPRTFAGTGVRGGPRMHHLRMRSRIEFDLWRKVLSPPKIVDLEVHNGREMTRG